MAQELDYLVLVQANPSPDGDGGVYPPQHDDEGFDVCVVCGHEDVGMWAHDGEADRADYWDCEARTGGCGASGALVRRDTPNVTLNGVTIPDAA